MYAKFYGAATAGNGVVVFAPDADCVGLWDPATQTFTCPSIASTISMNNKFTGAATAGNSVVVCAWWPTASGLGSSHADL